MNIQVKQTKNKEAAFDIAKSLPDFFNDSGINQIKESLEQDIVFEAFVDDNMVGFVTFKEFSDEVIELEWLAIRADYQSKGIGTHLVNESIDKLSKKYLFCKVKTLAETVEDEGYERTRRFYRKLGFTPLEVIDPFPGWEKGNPCLIMIKTLV